MVDQRPSSRLSPVVSSLPINLNTENQTKQQQQEQQQRNDSPIAQVRSYVEKQMDQLQQDLAFGFSRTPKVPPLPSTSPPNLFTNTITPVRLSRSRFLLFDMDFFFFY